MRTKSNVDHRCKILIYTIIGFMAALGVVMPISIQLALTETLIGCLAVLSSSALLLWLLHGTYYELREDYLYCRSGPFIEKIPYNSIKMLSLSDNRFSSLALSMYRIEIYQYSKGYNLILTMISPQGRELFLARLRQRCINLERIA